MHCECRHKRSDPTLRRSSHEPVLIGGLEMGRHLIPGTPLAGEHSAEEIRQIAAGLE